jgi:pimeloyl-ACP methyl ester carboxylesterase
MAAGSLPASAQSVGESIEAGALARVAGSDHWADKVVGNEKIKLYMLRKRLEDPATGKGRAGTIVFVHGSSVSATPAFDLQVAGRPELSAMDWYARLGYDTWCFDCEGYGRSDKSRAVNADVSMGADDLAAVSDYIMKLTGDDGLLIYGASSGALRAGVFAERHPDRVRRLALDALVYTGEGSPTLEQRRKRLAEYRANNRREISETSIQGIFSRDHVDSVDLSMVEPFAAAVLALDKTVPTGTYLDMSANLPVCDPGKITAPTLIMRGEYDGIATFEDCADFFALLPNPDKQFTILPGIAHTTFFSKNWALAYDVLDAWFGRPKAVYTG